MTCENQIDMGMDYTDSFVSFKKKTVQRHLMLLRYSVL